VVGCWLREEGDEEGGTWWCSWMMVWFAGTCKLCEVCDVKCDCCLMRLAVSEKVFNDTTRIKFVS
jgi:predicted metal-binding protein